MGVEEGWGQRRGKAMGGGGNLSKVTVRWIWEGLEELNASADISYFKDPVIWQAKKPGPESVTLVVWQKPAWNNT